LILVGGAMPLSSQEPLRILISNDDGIDEPGMDKTDVWAFRNGYISLTPFQIDQTDRGEAKTPLDSLQIGNWKR
jgi:broad specificity polyphosphatase/5'/3'-nucleotidase SurE